MCVREVMPIVDGAFQLESKQGIISTYYSSPTRTINSPLRRYPDEQQPIHVQATCPLEHPIIRCAQAWRTAASFRDFPRATLVPVLLILACLVLRPAPGVCAGRYSPRKGAAPSQCTVRELGVARSGLHSGSSWLQTGCCHCNLSDGGVSAFSVFVFVSAAPVRFFRSVFSAPGRSAPALGMVLVKNRGHLPTPSVAPNTNSCRLGAPSSLSRTSALFAQATFMSGRSPMYRPRRRGCLGRRSPCVPI
ncbi:hypothetical protein EDB89DRAFT_1932220 [Lactarius sanguifluus]|nr:hypothetical protein EDB89DRAFT_1932220 [Lactarius sanguifluus]